MWPMSLVFFTRLANTEYVYKQTMLTSIIIFGVKNQSIIMMIIYLSTIQITS
jgi:hypothetical protein